MKERKIRTWFMGSALVAALLLSAGSLQGAAYMKIGDIKGEAKDDGHKDEIDVLSWSWGMSRPDTSGGGGGTDEAATFKELSVIKRLDKATPKLMEACASGNPIPDAVLTMRKSNEQPLEYLIITMRDVLVTSVSTGGSGGEDRLTENVTLNFAQIRVEYIEQDEEGNGVGEPVEFQWDIKGNNPG